MRGSIEGSAFDIASQRLNGEKKVQKRWSRQNVRHLYPRAMEPALGVSFKSFRLAEGNWGFIPGRNILKTLKVVFVASRQALGTTGSAKG